MKNICNLCNADSFELIKSELRDEKEKFKVYRCNSCGHIQLLPKPSGEDDREFYDKNLQDKNRGKEIDYKKLYNNNLFDTRRHVRLVKELKRDTDCSILDIGAGYGFFVNALYGEGYKNVLGIEISRERRELAIENGAAKIIDCDINRPSNDIGMFDVITIFHVLEHIGQPVEFLEKLKTYLNPGGVLVCEVPNVDELLIAECPPYNDFYWIRAHLNYFGKKTLSDCFRQAGFEKREIRFEQRYGLLNLSNWLTTGLPQIDCPLFEIPEAYKPVEKLYRTFLEEKGVSDAVIMIAGVQ